MEPNEQAADPYLYLWVYMANRNGTEAGITLMVGGTIVSGTLISFNEWMRELESTILGANTVTPEANAGMVEGLRDLRIQFEAEELAAAESEDDETVFTKIHLRNAIVHNNDTTFRTAQWRGEMSRVDAWWLGEPTSM